MPRLNNCIWPGLIGGLGSKLSEYDVDREQPCWLDSLCCSQRPYPLGLSQNGSFINKSVKSSGNCYLPQSSLPPGSILFNISWRVIAQCLKPEKVA